MSALAAGIAAAGSVASSLISNSNAAGMNEDQRNWQENENQRNREFAERMYTQYQSPQAIVNQMRDAGVNPFVGDSISAGSPNSAPSGSPSMVSPPPFNFGSDSFLNGMALEQRQKQIDADYDYRLAQTSALIAETIGEDEAQQYWESNMGTRYGHLSDETRSGKMWREQYSIRQNEKKLSDIRSKVSEKYDDDTAAETLANLRQTFVKINAEIGKMASDAKVNDATIKKLVADEFKSYAEGNKAVAETNTINQSRQYLIGKLTHEANLLYYEDETIRSQFDSEVDFRRWLTSPEGRDNTIKLKGIQRNPRQQKLKSYVDAIRGLSDWQPNVSYSRHSEFSSSRRVNNSFSENY